MQIKKAVIIILLLLVGLATSLYALDLIEHDKLVASDGADRDRFGFSAAIDDNTAIIGARLDDNVSDIHSGSAYVFQFDDTVWTQQDKLLASDAASGDSFGFSVAINGNTAIVGAVFDDDVLGSSGSGYIFQYDGTSWNQQAKLTAQPPVFGGMFGWSVALDGDTAIIGAPGNPFPGSDSFSNAGSAYIFKNNGTNWIQEALLTANDATLFDKFGVAVAISGDTVIVGSPEDDDAGNQSGSAYIFQFNGASWDQQAKLTASDAAAGDNFGASVAISDNTVIVGSRGDDDAGTSSGSAYIFQYEGTSWSQQAKLTANDAAAVDHFGRAVSIDGNTAIIGATGQDTAYVFQFDDTSWSQKAKLTPSDAPSASFGFSVAINGNIAIVGATGEGDVGENAGSAYVYLLPDNLPVSIDISPGVDSNLILCRGNTQVTVAILTTDDFDALKVDHTTVTFEGASEIHTNPITGESARHEKDVDGDEDQDLVLHFRLGDTGLTCDSTEGTLIGETFDDQAIIGTDIILLRGRNR